MGLPEKTGEIEDLCRDCIVQIEGILRKYRNNSSIVRMMYVNCNIVKEAYPLGGIKYFYNVIYNYGVVEGYYTAGKCFEKNKFDKQAVEAYNSAIEAGNNLKKEELAYGKKIEIAEKARESKHIIKMQKKGKV